MPGLAYRFGVSTFHTFVVLKFGYPVALLSDINQVEFAVQQYI